MRKLEPAVIAELMLRAGPGDLPRSSGPPRPGITVSEASAELIERRTWRVPPG